MSRSAGQGVPPPGGLATPPNPPDAEFPFALSTGRVVYHFHTRTKTGRSRVLNELAPRAYVEIHPEDAARLNIGLGDIVEVDSRRGRWEGPALRAIQ